MKFYLKEIRTEQLLGVRALAEKSGVAKSYIGAIEKGGANPTIRVLCRLAAALEVDVGDLFSCE